MKLGIVADEVDRDFAKAVEIGKRVGLHRYEVRFLKSGRAPMCDREELMEVERIAQREGVEITALSPGLFKLTGDEAAFARELSEIYPRAAEWAHRWQLPGLIVFGFHKPGATEAEPGVSGDAPDRVIDWMRRAAECAEADGLTLMIEPEPICWADTARRAAAMIEKTGARSLRINYDPGNVAWLENRDPLDDFPAAARWIANVHVKDLRPLTRGPAHPEWAPAGEGMIDYRAHCLALQSAGYQGPISLEPHMDRSEEATRLCKAALEKAWKEGMTA